MLNVSLIVSACLTGLAQQPLPLGWLAWFSLIPFILNIQKICSFQDHVKLGFIWGFFYSITVVFWIAQNLGTNFTIGIISMFATVILFACNFIILTILYYFVKQKLGKFTYLLLPIMWVVMEYLRSFGTLANPWMSLSNTQTNYTTLIQIAEFTGIYGVTFWIVLLNVLGHEFLRNPYKKTALSWITIFMVPLIIGLWIQPTESQKHGIDSIDITIVQPNVHLSEKRQQDAAAQNISKLLQKSFKDNYTNRLIFWPETSTMSYLLQNGTQYLHQIQHQMRAKKSELLTGLPVYKINEQNEFLFYNSIAHIGLNKVKGLYDKIHLVPMGEYIPFSPIFPSLKSLNLGQANFEHGKKFTIFQYKDVKLGGMVCLESTFPQLNRKFVNKGAEILFYVVNDGWYETPPQPQQHAKQTVFRAIEFRRPIIRCANTGISQVVHPSGNIQHQTQLNKDETIYATVFPNDKITFYARYGDVFSWINILGLCLIFGRGYIQRCVKIF